VSKKNRDSGGAAVLDAPAPEARAAYRFTFRACRWLPLVLTVEGCRDEADARAKLHELVDAHIQQVERGR
jgi:hypothetical protein